MNEFIYLFIKIDKIHEIATKVGKTLDFSMEKSF